MRKTPLPPKVPFTVPLLSRYRVPLLTNLPLPQSMVPALVTVTVLPTGMLRLPLMERFSPSEMDSGVSRVSRDRLP